MGVAGARCCIGVELYVAAGGGDQLYRGWVDCRMKFMPRMMDRRGRSEVFVFMFVYLYALLVFIVLGSVTLHWGSRSHLKWLHEKNWRTKRRYSGKMVIRLKHRKRREVGWWFLV